MTKSIVQTLLELRQAWCHDHFPGEPFPVTDHPLSKEPFPNVQSELHLTPSHAISLCPANPALTEFDPKRSGDVFYFFFLTSGYTTCCYELSSTQHVKF